jgi:acylphosphatase
MITSKGSGSSSLTMTLNVSGIVDDVGFEEFATHYARRLNLVGRYESLGTGLLRITLFGRSELIEMFGMACSLGPRRSSVDKVELVLGTATNCDFDDFEIMGAEGTNGRSLSHAKLDNRT